MLKGRERERAMSDQKKLVGGIMLSTGLTAFLTGITEPLEFSFMFVAWPLYVIHSLLTGTSMALVNALGIHDGFTFSAGFFDYVLNFGKATNAWMLIPIGLGYAVIYYFLFSFVIKKWNLRTPGREEEVEVAAGEPDPALLEAELALAAEGDSRTDAPLVAELENKLDKELEGR